jgi:ATP-dependent DNA helicase RecG
MNENQYSEKKSLRLITSGNPNWRDLAKDCVAFANARGGIIAIGIEDNDELPPSDQKISENLPQKIQKRISELTINTGVTASILKASNSGEYIAIKIFPSEATIASTSDGQYYYRVSDSCIPLLPDELMGLLTDKPSFIWETKKIVKVSCSDYDYDKLRNFVASIKNSERVSKFVKNKTDEEILEYYLMVDGNSMTNLGVLWIGNRNDRARLSYAPVIQFIKYDENEKKIKKIVWDDYSLNPAELVHAVWEQISDWSEGIEISDGLFRKFIPNYEEEVVRELLVNALAHRPYTMRGDIFINLYHDHLEICNPGLLPLGVTPDNILHKTIRRNDKLAQVFYDLMLMEREGSGYDKIYATLLGNGKQIPQIIENEDSVTVIIRKKILKTEIVSFLGKVSEVYDLNEREIICLGLIAQHTTLSQRELARILGISILATTKNWLENLKENNLINSRGKTKGIEYYINPKVLQKNKFKGRTNLKKIEPHRLRELILADLSTYPNSPISEIHERIGTEITLRKTKLILDELRESGMILSTGTRRWTRYSINADH